MKLKDLKGIIFAPELLVFDKAVNKVHSFENREVEAVMKIYGEKEVEAIYPCGIKEVGVTVL